MLGVIRRTSRKSLPHTSSFPFHSPDERDAHSALHSVSAHCRCDWLWKPYLHFRNARVESIYRVGCIKTPMRVVHTYRLVKSSSCTSDSSQRVLIAAAYPAASRSAYSTALPRRPPSSVPLPFPPPPPGRHACLRVQIQGSNILRGLPASKP